ncbi:hypothetical protein I4U23_027525 [Adineta vaga]|nr:hypothetical protein I4U23_027525 [Adineta vaga]
MTKITVINHNAIEVHHSSSIDSNLVLRNITKTENTLCCHSRKQKILCVISLILILSAIIIGTLIPTVVIRKDKSRISSLSTTTIRTVSTRIATTTTIEITTKQIVTTKKTENITTEKGQISLVAVKNRFIGIHSTMIGGDSSRAEEGLYSGYYIAGEHPANACDNDVKTKYVNYGSCKVDKPKKRCGLQTGFYYELKHGQKLVNGLKICTADDLTEHDPILVSLEGNNYSGSNLAFSPGWTLLYNGTSGLDIDPGRQNCSSIINFTNFIEYKSYRFLVHRKRGRAASVQYSEVQLFNN